MRNNHKLGKKLDVGFTLIELLVVIAMTVILLTVLFAPLIQAFQFTEQAQATAEAQDAARLVTEQITRELGSAAAVRDTTGNYLDIPLDTKTGGVVIARSFNAYIDIVPPRTQNGTIVDPTVDPTVPTFNLGGQALVTGLNPELSSAGLGLPLSAGSTVIRYFPGLRYPINPHYVAATTIGGTDGTAPDSLGGPLSTPGDPQPYINQFDKVQVASSSIYFKSYVAQNDLNNTYQLYRANFQPFVIGASGKFGPNQELFAVSNGAPVLDDPDFFRIVLIGDPDYVTDPTGKTAYTLTTAKNHNDRTFNWWKIAKEVISTRDIDLVGLPRAGKSIVYDTNGNPVDSYDTSTPPIPLVRTTINFAPALISNDPMAPSNSANESQGYGGAPNLLNPATTSLPFVPTLFQSQYGNWQGTPAVTITKSVPAQGAAAAALMVLQTRAFTATDQATGYTLGTPNYSGTMATAPALGDLILSNVSSGTPGTPVYDVSLSTPINVTAAASQPIYDAMILDKSRGVVTFAVPALPTAGPVQNPPNTYFTVSSPFNANNLSGPLNVIYLGDYLLLPGTPLKLPSYESAATNPNYVQNAAIVINSERVVGPDLSSGLIDANANTDLVQYTRVASGVPQQANQYSVDYQNNTITFAPDKVPSSVQIAFNYQNNLSVPTSQNASDTVDTVRASYYSAMIMRLNLGVRVYGGATGNSEYFSLNSQVGVGNSKAN